MNPKEGTEKNPDYQANQIRIKIQELIKRSREAVNEINKPKAQALFETTVEILSGLATAYGHYQERTGPAWKENSETTEEIGAATDGAPD